jgi:hypothetical protein
LEVDEGVIVVYNYEGRSRHDWNEDENDESFGGTIELHHGHIERIPYSVIQAEAIKDMGVRVIPIVQVD